MNEEKYYVRLKIDGQLLNSSGFYDEELGCDEYNEFTKSELSKIMDGALYKQSDCLPFQWLYSREQLRNDLGWEYNETIDKWEWKNQLIELVPVEEE